VTPVSHKLARRIPWVTFHEDAARPCRVCGAPAHWSYRSVKRQAQLHDGALCWDHLASHGLFADADETTRTERWMAKR
jgi:hypothetical protein